jgi:hypothetical protein
MATESSTRADTFRLQVALKTAGMSPGGVQQFLSGQVVALPADREALLELVQNLIGAPMVGWDLAQGKGCWSRLRCRG